jgi:putative peptidoglycan lipid II flippase
MIRNAMTVGAWTMASRLLGFLRDILIAALLGAGPAADAFFVALRLPNLFRRLFGEGAFSAAFIPEYTGRLRHDNAAAHELAEDVTALMVVWLFGLTVAGLIFMPYILDMLAPGFRADPAKFRLAVKLSRITFPYLWLICLCALFSGVLNARGRFTAAAAAPLLFNICIIGALLLLRQTTGLATSAALAYGVAAAGIAQFAMLGRALAKAGAPIRLIRPRLSPGARLVLRRLGPGLIGAGVTQLNLTVDTIIASLLPGGTVSVLYYADRVNQLPLGVIGTALGTALLPALSRQLRHGALTEVRFTLNRAIEAGLLLTLPGAAALGVIALPVMRTLFDHGAFSLHDAERSASALVAYAAGLPAFVLVKLFAPGFFARGDTRTPVKIGVVAVALNLALNLALMHPLQQVGVALSTTIAAWFNAGALGLMLNRRGDFVPDARLAQRAPRILAATLLMALALWVARRFGVMALPHLAALAVLVTLGLAVFGLSGVFLHAFNPRDLMGLLRRPAKPDPA